MLPDKYGDGTHIGEPRNGYQLVDDAGELKMKRKPDVSGYDADDLTKLTEHRDAHVLDVRVRLLTPFHELTHAHHRTLANRKSAK